MFIGEYFHLIDQKGRLTLPAKFREELGDKFVITKGLDNCLFVYPIEEWKILENKLRKLPFTKSDARSFVRFFFSGATECEFDKQGRIIIPQNLRDHANLEKESIIIGVSSRIEVWSKNNWEEYSTETEDDYEDIAEKLEDLDINL